MIAPEPNFWINIINIHCSTQINSSHRLNDTKFVWMHEEEEWEGDVADAEDEKNGASINNNKDSITRQYALYARKIIILYVVRVVAALSTRWGCFFRLIILLASCRLRTQNVYYKLSRQTLCGSSLYPIKLTVELFLSQECWAKQPKKTENKNKTKRNELKW